MRILFYNDWHNGDIHMSRGYLRDLMSIYGEGHQYYYKHYNNPRLLKDIPNLGHVKDESELPAPPDMRINLWIGQVWDIYFGCNFPSYYGVMRNAYSSMGIVGHLKPIEAYVPSIDYSAFCIDGIRRYFSERRNRHILICNNDVSSGQAPNMEFNPLIGTLASRYRQTTFVVTNDKKNEPRVQMPNVVYVPDIIGTDTFGCDLNEISYISTFCDFIIGQTSGPYSFSITKETVRSKQFICFCYGQRESWFFHDSTNLVWSNDYPRMDSIIVNRIDSVSRNSQ